MSREEIYLEIKKRKRDAPPGDAKKALAHTARGGCHDWIKKLRADDARSAAQPSASSMFSRLK